MEGEEIDLDFDVESIASEFASLSVYRDDGAESSGTDGGSSDSFEAQGSVIAASAVVAQQEDARSTSSSRSRDGLPFAIKKELVLAIEARNGIEAVKTAKLLLDFPQYKSTEFLKSQVGNKISRWKGNQRNEYESIKIAIASELQQQQAHLQRQQQPDVVHSSNTRARPPLPPRSSVVSAPLPSPQLSSPQFASPQRGSPQRASPQRASPQRASPQRASPQLSRHVLSPQHILSPSNVRPPRPFSPLPAGMNTTLHAMASTAQLITVNSDMPERNTPFKVYRFENHELPSGKVANGYIIELQDQDPRFLMSKFTGTEIPSFEGFAIGEHEVLFKTPSTSFTFLHDERAEAQGLAEAGILDKTFTQPITIARNAIIRDAERQYDTWRLIFPEPLDNNILCEGAENGSIKPKVQPVVSKYKINLKAGVTELSSYRVNILWKIAQNESVLRSTKTNKKKNPLDEQATTIFGALARLGMLTMTPHPPSTTSSAIVVSSSAVVSSNIAAVASVATGSEQPVGSTAKRAADCSKKKSKRHATAVGPPPSAGPPPVAIHPNSKEELDETKAVQLVDDFAKANNLSYNNAVEWIKNMGANDWQTAVDIVVNHSSNGNPSPPAEFTTTAVASAHPPNGNKASAFDRGGFKETVDDKATHRSNLEAQQEKRAARKLKKQTQMRQAGVKADSIAVAQAETETVDFDNKDAPASDALLSQDQPFSYGRYRDSHESDSDSMGSLGRV